MSIEERVLRLSLDDSDFQRGADDSISKIDQLKSALNFGDISNSADVALAAFSGVSSTIGTVANTAVEGANTISSAFNNAWNLIYSGFMQTIGFGLANQITSLVESCTIAPISDGWAKYEESVNAVQKIMINTGYAIEDVEERLNTLATYSDQTSYGYTDMANALSTFVSAGQNLDDSVTAIIGLSNWCATAGVNAQTAEGAYNMFSKSVQAGFMSLQQWYSLQKTYNLGTTKFYDNLKESAIQMKMMKENTDGTITVWNKLENKWDDDKYESVAGAMQQTLKYQWLNTDLLFDVMGKYGSTTEDIMNAIADGDVTTVSEAVEQLGVDTEAFGYKAMLSAQQAKTLTDTIEAWKDVVSTQYRGIFEDVFGNYEEAAVFWTDICDTIGAFFWDLPYAIHDLTTEWHSMESGIFTLGDNGVSLKVLSNYEAFTTSLLAIGEAFLNLKYALEDAFTDVFGSIDAEDLTAISNTIFEFAHQLKYVWLGEESLENIKDILIDLAKPLKMVLDLVHSFWDILTDFIRGTSFDEFTDEAGNLYDQFAWVAALTPIMENFMTVLRMVADAAEEVFFAFSLKRRGNGLMGEDSTTFDALVSDFDSLLYVLQRIGSVVKGGIAKFLGFDTMLTEGGTFASVLNRIVGGFDSLSQKLYYLQTPYQALEQWFSEKSDLFKFGKNLKSVNNNVMDLGRAFKTTFSYDYAKGLLNDESFNVIKYFFGGDTPEEAWDNAVDAWRQECHSNPIYIDGEEIEGNMWNGMSFGEWLDECLVGSDLDYFDMFMIRLQTIMEGLPTINELLDSFWDGFVNANQKYDFGLPETWGELLDQISEFIETIKTFVDENVGTLLASVFPNTGTDAVTITSMFEFIGEIVGTVVGVVTEWNGDRWNDVFSLLDTAMQLIDIVVYVIKYVSGIAEASGIDTSPEATVDMIRSVSDAISGIVQAFGVMIDAIAVGCGVSEGKKMEQGVEDLGAFGELAANVGTIIGNILPGLLSIVETIAYLVADLVEAGAATTGTDAFQNVLAKLNEAIKFVGDLIISILDWTNDKLAGRTSDSDLSGASATLQNVMNFVLSIFQPLIDFFAETDFSQFQFTSVDGYGDSGTLLDGIFNFVLVLVDYTSALAGVITDKAADLAVKVIENAGRVIDTLLKQFVIISTSFSAMGGAGAITNIAASITALNLASLGISITGIFDTIMKYGKVLSISVALKNFSSAIWQIAKSLIVVILAIIALGFMFTNYPGELIAGFIALALVCAAMGFGILLFYKSYLALSKAADKAEKVDPLERALDSVADSISALATSGLMFGFTALFGTLILGLVALTAITAYAPGGIGALIASTIALCAIIGMVFYATTKLMDSINEHASKMKEVGSKVEAMVLLAGIVAMVYAIGIIAGAMILLVSGMAVLFAGIDKLTGGQAWKYILAAVGILLVVGALVGAMLVGFIYFFKQIEKLLSKPNWQTVASLGVIVMMMITVAGLILGLMYGVAAIMVALSVANNVKWSTMLKGLVTLVVMVALMGVVIYALTKLDANKFNKIKMPTWESIGKIAVFMLLFLFMYKTIINAIVQLSAMSTGNVDPIILWHVVAVMAVVALIAVGLAKLIAKMDTQVQENASFGKTFAAVIMLMLGMLSFMTLMVWLLAKYGTDRIDVSVMWKMLGVMAVVALIIAALMFIVKFFPTTKTGLVQFASMMAGILVTFGLLLLATYVLSKIHNVDTEAIDAVMSIAQMLIVLAAVIGLVPMLISLIPALGEFAVALGALFAVAVGFAVLAFATAIYLLVAAVNKLAETDPESIVEGLSAVGKGLTELFGEKGAIIGIATGIAGAWAICQGSFGEILGYVGLFIVAIIVIAALIAMAIEAFGGSTESVVNAITAAINAISTNLPSWFESILTATGDCMIELVAFIGEYTPMIVAALVEGIQLGLEQAGIMIKTGVQGNITEGMTDNWLASIEADPENKANYVTAAQLMARQEFGVDAMSRNEAAAMMNSDEFTSRMQQIVADLYTQYSTNRIASWDEDNPYYINGLIKESDVTAAGFSGENMWADYAAYWMRSDPDAFMGTGWQSLGLDEFLNDSELAYFAEAYPELFAKTGLEIGNAAEQGAKELDYWNKYYGDTVVEGAEEIKDDADEASGILEGIGDQIMSGLGLDNLSLDAITEKFGSLDTSGMFGNWGAAFSSFGEGTTGTGVLNILTQMNLVDSDGNVLSGEGTDLFNQLLGNSGALTGSDGSITSVQGLVDVVTTGGTLSFNGQEINIGDGDLGSLISGLITQSSTESEPAVVSNDVVIEGNTFFNTSDVMGDATTLQTEGVALYETTGQLLGSALVSGFYSNYTAFSTKATSMVQQALTAFRSKYMSAYYAGQYIATGAINGMNSKKQEVYDAGKELGQQSILGYKKGGGIESPSKYTYEAGRFIGEGAINGMMSMATAVYNASYTLGDESVAGFSDAATVTPVLDTTAFQNGVGRINSTFADATALNAEYTVDVQGRAKSTKDMLAEAFSGFNDRLSGISNQMGFGEQLDRLGDRIGEMGFYVDGKKFARAMADHNDAALARNYIKRGRS